MQEGVSEERLLIGDTDAFGTEMSVYGIGGKKAFILRESYIPTVKRR